MDKIKITSIGGQAVIEGVMMRGPESVAIAVRKQDGSIAVDKRPVGFLARKHPFLRFYVIRGVAAFCESLVLGMKALRYSAELFSLQEEKPKTSESRFEQWLTKGNRLQDITMILSMLFAICFTVVLFILIPNFLAGLSFPNDRVRYNLLEGILRVAVFLGYIVLVSKLKDIQRVFEYHGAEHKVIHCYEHGEDLTIENARKYSTLHPRCGTSFLLIVMVVSIIIFSCYWSESLLFNSMYRILTLPLVAGLSYELIKVAGRSKNKVVQLLNLPGLWLQKLTTRQPNEDQLEVAITALKNVSSFAEGEDKW